MHESSRLFDASGRRIRLNKRLSVFSTAQFIPAVPGPLLYTLGANHGTAIVVPDPPSLSFPMILTQAFRLVSGFGRVRTTGAPDTIKIEDLVLEVVDPNLGITLLSWAANYSPMSSYGVVNAALSSLVFNSDFLSVVGRPVTLPQLGLEATITDAGLDAFAMELFAVMEIFDVVPSE